MFTRQHYKAIAEIIEENTDEEVSTGVTYPKIDKRNFTFKLADYFASDNERFDRVKFLDACNID